MIYVDDPYIFLTIGKTVDEFYSGVSFNKPKDEKAANKYVLKVSSSKQDHKSYIQNFLPGLLYDENNFYPVPITVFYVVILECKATHDYNRYCFSGKIKLHNKTFTKSQELCFEGNENGQYPLGLQRLTLLVNFLNKYINQFAEYENLDCNKLLEKIFTYKSPFKLDTLIGRLSMDFFYSEGRGKKTCGWTEVVISEVIVNSYFRSTLINFFNKKYGNCSLLNDIITVRLSQDSLGDDWGSGERTKLEDPYRSSYLKIEIGIWFGKHFNYDDYVFAEYEYQPTLTKQ